MTQIRRAAVVDMDGLFELAREFATSFRLEIGAFTTSFRHLIAQEDALLLVITESDQLLAHLPGFDHHALFANGRVA